LLWVVAAGLLGFLISSIFVGRLRLRRSLLLVPYVILVGAFLAGYFYWAEIDVAAHLVRRWPWGIAGAVLVGALMAKNVRSQPASPRSKGARLGFELAWWGLIYGIVDGLFLSVMPVLAMWQAFAVLAWSGTWYGKLLVGAAALVASTFVTAAYHLGYPEFRDKSVLLPVAGNGIMSLAYLLTTSPLAPVGAHAVMHVSAVLHGAESTVQLPPHLTSEDVHRAA
jgi:hypothetical protein